MNPIQNILASNGIITKAAGNVDYPGIVFDKMSADTGVYAPISTSDYIDLSTVHSDVYRAIKVRSESIASLQTRVEIAKGDEIENIIDQPEFEVLRKPNEWQTHFDFYEQTMQYLDAAGECPWLLELQGSKIISMLPINPSLLKVYPHNNFLVSHYGFITPTGQEIKIPPECIFFLKYNNPNDHLRGLSPITALKNEIVLDLQAQKGATSTFASGAKPSGVLAPEKDVDIEPAEYKALLKQIRENYQGSDNFGKIMALNVGMKWTPIQYSNADLQFMELRYGTGKAVGKVYGVPPIMMNDYKDASVLANADTQHKIFWDNIKPTLVKLEEIFTSDLLPRISAKQGIRYRFDLSKVTALKPDRGKEAELYKGGAGYTLNDYRVNVLNLDADLEDPNMRKKLMPNNMTFVDEPEVESNDPEEKAIRGLDLISKEINQHLIENDPKTMHENIQGKISNMVQGKEQRDFDIIRASAENFINQNVDRHSEKMIKSIDPIFTKQLNELLKNLQGQKMFRAPTSEDIMFNTNKYIREFESAGKPHIAKALKDAGQQFAKANGKSFDLNDPAVVKYINEASHEYAALSVDTTFNQVDNILKNSLAEKLTIEEISLLIEKYFENNQAMRSERIARTEMIRSTNKGRMESMLQLDFTHHMWLSQRDADVRSSHFKIDGTVVKVGSPFPQADDTMADPTFPSSINERCYTIPVQKPKN